MRFERRSILITGSGSGIGKAIAELVAREGAGRLILVDVDASKLAATGFACCQTRPER